MPVLLDFPPHPWVEGRSRYAELIRREDLRGAVELFVGDVMGPEAAEVIPESVWQHVLLNAGGFSGWVGSSNPFPEVSAEELGAIRIPVLMILGERDVGSAFETMSDAVVRHVPGAESVTIPGAGHVMWNDRPELTREILLGFLSRWSTGSSSFDHHRI